MKLILSLAEITLGAILTVFAILCIFIAAHSIWGMVVWLWNLPA